MLGARRTARLEALVADIEAAGGTARSRALDVTDRADVAGFAGAAVEAWGRVDVIDIGSIGALAVSPTAAVYCATKFAVRAISDGLRQEHANLRVTCIHPGVVESELASTITDAATAGPMQAYRSVALQPDAIARAVAWTIERPDDVDVDEMVVRPVRAA